MKKRLLLLSALCAFFFVSPAQSGGTPKGPDEIQFNGYSIRLFQTPGRGYGYDIFFQQTLIVHQDKNPYTGLPEGLKKKEGAPEETKTDVAKEAPLKETSGNANVVIVSDVDFMVERFSVQVQQIFGTKVAQLINDNQNFFQNIAENLLGSEDLISIRSRGQFARPFTKVEELETYAQQRWQQEEMGLQAELNAANNRLAELQGKAGAEGSSKQVLNKAFLDEIKQFKERKAKTQAQLRTVRRNLRQDIEHLGTLLFLMNTFMVPLALILGTIGYTALRKQ